MCRFLYLTYRELEFQEIESFKKLFLEYYNFQAYSMSCKGRITTVYRRVIS